MPPLQLYGSVGPEEENDPADVASVGNSLGILGLTGALEAARSGAWDNHFDATVKSFQETNGLDVDGVLFPGGPTQAAINRTLESRRDDVPDTFERSQSAKSPSVPLDGNRTSSSGEAGEIDSSSRNFLSARSRDLGANSVSGARGVFEPRRQERDWWEEDSNLPRLSDGVAKAIAAGAREREVQFANFLKLLGASRGASASVAPPAGEVPESDERDRILTARGYRYVPDPIGRVGWGDWVDGEGKPLDEKLKQAIVTSESTFGQNVQVHGERIGDAKLGLPRAADAAETTPRGPHDLNSAQTAVFARSDFGIRFAEAQNRIGEAALADGEVPLSVWHDELRRFGIEPGQIGAPPSSVTLVQHGRDPKESAADAKRTPQSFVGKAWSWLTDEFPGLAQQKAQAIERLDREIRAIEAEPGWRRNVLSLIARQSLLEARTGIVGGFPTSRLDFIFAGIDVIGVGMVSGRPLLILRKGSKVITSADLAEGGFRSRQALDLGKDVPYNSHSIRAWLDQRYGAEKITSFTVPPADYHLIQLAGRRHPVTGIVFSNKGYPIFDDIAKFDTRIPSEVFWKVGREAHNRHATLQLREAIKAGQVDARQFGPEQLAAITRGDERVPGFIWHHHEDLGRMQLVPAQIHEDTRHLGGRGLKKGK